MFCRRRAELASFVGKAANLPMEPKVNNQTQKLISCILLVGIQGVNEYEGKMRKNYVRNDEDIIKK